MPDAFLKMNNENDHDQIIEANKLQGHEIIRLSGLNNFTTLKNVTLINQCQDAKYNNDQQHQLHEKVVNLTIQCHETPLPNHIYSKCLDVFRTNMEALYRNSNWGFDLHLKQEELTHNQARFLIVTIAKGEREGHNAAHVGTDDEIDMLAFTHFRIECSENECNENGYYKNSTNKSKAQNDNIPHHGILYVYEIQIHPKLQRNGIGKRLMNMMEIMAMKLKLRKVMLTVFKENQNAMKFYKQKMKYEVDETSPTAEEEEDYEILSKAVQRRR